MREVRPVQRILLGMALLVLLTVASDVGDLGLPTSYAGPALEPGIAAKLSPRAVEALLHGNSGGRVRMIVTTGEAPAGLDAATLLQMGGTVTRQYAQLSGYAVSLPARSIRQLAGLPNVRHVSIDHPVEVENDLNYVTLGADIARKNLGLNGHDVVIAVLDTGIYKHPDLGSRLTKEVDFAAAEKDYVDYFGHGTHVAGIIAGNAHDSSDSKSFRRFYGVASDAKLISVRVLGRDGKGYVSDVLAGIDWVIANRAGQKIRIMNLSLGHPVEESYLTDPLCQAVEKAWKAGIVVVVSAGNLGSLGYGTIGSPGNDPYVITVGASNNYLTSYRGDDILATYSSLGPTAIDHFVKPDLVAPGNRTISLRSPASALDTTYPGLRKKYGVFNNDPNKASQDSPYFELSGTSMSAAVVSGMAAILIDADGTLTPDTVKARLMRSAEKRMDYNIFQVGAGFANLYAALQERGIALLPSRSPRAYLTPTGIVLETTDLLWGNPLSWNESSIWGGDPLRNTEEVGGDGAVWGGGGTLRSYDVDSHSGVIFGDNDPLVP